MRAEPATVSSGGTPAAVAAVEETPAESGSPHAEVEPTAALPNVFEPVPTIVEYPAGPLILPGELPREGRWLQRFGQTVAHRLSRRLILAALLLFGPSAVWLIFHRSAPSGEGAFRELKPFVANFLVAPKSAEFPAPEGISRIDSTTWRIDSHVGSKDHSGAPIRIHWECEAGFDVESGKYFPDSLILDGKRVFESPRAQQAREERERKLAAERELERQRQKQAEVDAKLRQRKASEDAKQAQIEARQKEREAEGERQLAQRQAKIEAEYKEARDLKERRTSGNWKVVSNFSGERSNDRVWGLLAPTLSGWRLKYKFAAPARIQFYSPEGKRVGPEIKLAAGSGVESPPWARPGQFKIAVESKEAWSIAIEE